MRSTLINTVLPAFQAVIGSDIIKPVSKRTSAGNTSTTINTTTDEIWLYSEYEIFGTINGSVPGEKPTDKSICYPAFTDAASRIKKVGASGERWLERSPYVSSSEHFCTVRPDGIEGAYPASTTLGVVVGFCI